MPSLGCWQVVLLATNFFRPCAAAEENPPFRLSIVERFSYRLQFELTQFGWLCESAAMIEGQNIAIEYRYAEGKRDRFSALAAELVRLKVEIIVVAGGDLLTQAAKNATKTIPIVMTGTGADPVEAGLVDSLARPGGNVTGVTLLNKDLGGKRLELLKVAVPKIAHVAVFYDSAIPAQCR